MKLCSVRQMRLTPLIRPVTFATLAWAALALTAAFAAEESKPVMPAAGVMLSPDDAPDDVVRKAAFVVPSPRQIAWHQREFAAFIHFGGNTTSTMIRREGKHVYLELEKEDTAAITPEHFDRWIAHLDAAYEAMADLTGRAPLGGSKIGIVSTRQYPGGWAVAGNPIRWHRPYVKRSLADCDATDEWCFGIVHEIGHDFDENGAWNFNGEFWANFKLHYVIETLNGRIIHDKLYSGKELVNYWKSDAGGSFEKGWRNPDPAKRTVHHDGLQYKMIVIKDKVGWEPFKKTFRWFHSLPADQKPRGAWNKFKTFHDKLAEFAGFDVWSVYNEEELKLLKVQYGK